MNAIKYASIASKCNCNFVRERKIVKHFIKNCNEFGVKRGTNRYQ